ncbi:MAG: hypothetical protein AAF404_09050, partial [Pseudomonadota bacterium]
MYTSNSTIDITPYMLRLEDPALLCGHGQYTDDFNRSTQLVMRVLRAPVAHAGITGLNTDNATALPGVHCVLTATDADIASLLPMQCRAQLQNACFAEPSRPVLADSQVKRSEE